MKTICPIHATFFFFFFLATPGSAIDIGQRFILTLPAAEDRTQLTSWLEQTKPAGVMLVAGHFSNRAKTKELISFLQHEAKRLNIPPLFITVDWEGGIVSRPTEAGGFYSIPSPWALAHAGRDTCYRAGMLVGQQMAGIGANMNFAPSLDLFDSTNSILATRCFSDDEKIVAESGIAFAKGLLSQGALPVIKHFPGLGLGKLDTHNTSVGIDADTQTLEKNRYPFKEALAAGIPCIMPTHAIFKQFGSEPITLSAKAASYLHTCNPEALLITDDFAMKAVQHNRTIENAAWQSLTAGYDLIIFSGILGGGESAIASQIKLINTLQEKIDTLDAQQIKQLNACEQRIKTFKQKYLKQQHTVLPAFDEAALSRFLAQRCFPNNAPHLTTKNIVLFSVKLPAIRPPEQWFINGTHSYFGQQLIAAGKNVTEYIFDPLDPKSIDELTQLVSTHQDADNTTIIAQTFFYADNTWNTIQIEWLKALAPLGDNVLILSLGHPLEHTYAPNAHVITLGSFHKPLLDNAAQYVCSAQPTTGASRLAANPGHFLAGKNFGLLCNTGSVATINNTEYFLPDVLVRWSKNQHDGTKLAALFSPEHGLMGTAEAFANVDSEANSRWGCPIYSLHGAHRAPMPEWLSNLDLLLIDLQDVGTRCYTYLSTTKLVLAAAAQANVPVLLLDRPNPLAFWGQAGPRLDKQCISFVGAAPIPFLHGKTLGGIAQLLNQTIDAELTVIPCQGTKNNACVLHTGPAPSPNLPTPDHIFAYPLTVFLEGTNYSEGRGTPYPFLQIGAPWVDAEKLAQYLNAKKLPGVYYEPIHFTPQRIAGKAENPKHNNARCGGVFLHVYNYKAVKPMLCAQTILETLFALYPQQSTWIKSGNRYFIDLLVGNDSWRKKIQKSAKLAHI